MRILGLILSFFLTQGILQDVRVVAGPHGYLSQCPRLDSVCPTCGQFQLLQATVEDLTARVNQLVQKVSLSKKNTHAFAIYRSSRFYERKLQRAAVCVSEFMSPREPINSLVISGLTLYCLPSLGLFHPLKFIAPLVNQFWSSMIRALFIISVEF